MNMEPWKTTKSKYLLRALAPHGPQAVTSFLEKYKKDLAARVKREVTNKLTTGLKNPRRRRKPP